MANNELFVNKQVAKNLSSPSMSRKASKKNYIQLNTATENNQQLLSAMNFDLIKTRKKAIPTKKHSNHHQAKSSFLEIKNFQKKFHDGNWHDDDSAIGMSNGEKQPLVYSHYYHYKANRMIDDEFSYKNGIPAKESIANLYPSLNQFDPNKSSGRGSRDYGSNESLIQSSLPLKCPIDSNKNMMNKENRLTSNIQTMMHILKGNIGTGILAMPNAFMNAGLYVGLGVLPLLAFLCTHCMHILVRSNRKLAERLGGGMLEYQEVAEQAILVGPKCLRRYSKVMGNSIEMFLLITQLGFCCVYSLFVAENVAKFVTEISKNTIQLNSITYLMILLPLFILLSFVKSLKHLSLASSIANLLQTVGLLIVMSNLVQNLPNPNTVDTIGKLSKFPLFIGTAIYAFEGIGLVLPLQKEMREPNALGGKIGVLNTAMTIVACLNVAIGFFGYLKFGNSVTGSITLNLPTEPLYQSCTLIFALAIFLSYAIQYYVPINIIWPWFKQRCNLSNGTLKSDLFEYFFRAFLVSFTVLLAAAIPKLDLFISLVGAFSSSCLALIIPPLIDICVRWEEDEGCLKWTWIFLKNFCIFLLGLIGFSTGTYASIENIVQHIYD